MNRIFFHDLRWDRDKLKIYKIQEIELSFDPIEILETGKYKRRPDLDFETLEVWEFPAKREFFAFNAIE